MKKIVVLLSYLILAGCSYHDTSIVDAIYLDHGPDPSQYDGSTGNTANQWKETNFTSSEMALFNDLDTVKLEGTSSTLIFRQLPAYPNPFQSVIIISTGFNGSVIAKYVIVDSYFHPIQKKSIRLNIPSTSFQISNIPKGKYRIYVTYSTLGNEHFFKFWGNIWHN